MQKAIFLDLIKKIELDNKKIILILITTLVIFYIDYSFIVAGQRAGIKSLRPKIAKLKEDIANLKKNLQNIDNLKAGKTQGIAARQIISEGNLALLLEKIANIANSRNVNIRQIKPVKEEKPLALDSKVSAQPANLFPVYLNLDLSAGYHNLGNFINDLENLQELIIVGDIKIRRQEEDYLKETAELLLRIYVKR